MMYSCNFIQFTDISGTSEPISREFGIWQYQYWSMVFTVDADYIVKTCHGYNEEDIVFDASWKAAKAFSIMTFIFAIGILIAYCVAACADFEGGGEYSGTSQIMVPIYLIVALCQGLTLLFLNSNACKDNGLVDENLASGTIEFPDQCSLGPGAKIVISATVFWACAALTSFQEWKAQQEERTAVEPVSLTEPFTA